MYGVSLRMGLLTLALGACAGREHLRKGDDWMERGNYAAAARAYTRADEARPDSPRVQARLAHARVLIGDYEGALEPARAAVAAKQEQAIPDLARALLETGDTAGAAQVLSGVVLSHDLQADLALVQGEVFLTSGDRENAAKALEQAAALGSVRALTLLAWLQAREGQTEQAKQNLARVAELASDDPQALALAAGVPVAMADAESSQSLASLALGLDASLKAPEGWSERSLKHANLLWERGDRERALWLGSAAWAVKSDDGRIALVLGPWWMAAEGYTQAILLFQTALETEPFGVSEEGAFTEYHADYTITESEVLAGRRRIAQDLARAWHQLGDPRQEAAALQVLIAADDPDRPAHLVELAEAWLAAGEVDSASQALTMGAQAGSLEAALRLAKAAEESGDLNAAVYWGLMGWRMNRPDPQAALALARLYEARGERKAAVQVVNEALAANPNHPELLAAAELLRQPVKVDLPAVFRPRK